MQLILFFLAGLFLVNAIPHFVKGITGQTHMTPFKRVSSPIMNVLYGFVNIIFALLILGYLAGTILALPWNVSMTGIDLVSFLLGGLFIAYMDASLFGKPNAHLPWQK